MALLRSRGHWICGGTLINARYVLTAAHCVQHRAIDYVRLGELELNQAIDCDLRQEVCAPEPQDITIERVIIHEDYSVRRRVNDIALLRLARPATLHESVVPICLPVAPAMQTKLSTYYVAGWGSTQDAIFSNKLQFTELNLMPKDECLTRLREEDKFMRLFDTQVCAIGAMAKSDNCVGDSGGPLKSVSVNARFVQYGIVSYGLNSCGKKSAPGVYTRVESYIDWILDRLEA
ncbi:AGAP009220-PA-like protein [Anopheles sinensis]|uniref:AGAP009220-PA-like protein n=1 Tax=Anopheles sinensis TaxID=74873 RepID=A0A084WQL7_ANOSI|nr:AGAP009220-PA-like protein [Anopheles sinensis]